jgi:hypothetical protein
MTELDETVQESRSPVRVFLHSLVTDEPWGPARSRSSLFATLTIAGIIGGVLQGLVVSGPHLKGDALYWEHLEAYAGYGLAVGLSLGFASILSRNLWVRVTLGTLLGAILITLRTWLYEWLYLSAPPERELQSQLQAFLDVVLAGPLLASLELAVHLVRRMTGQLRLVLSALLISSIIGLRGEALTGEAWKLGNLHRGSGVYLGPGWMSGAILALCFAESMLCLELLSLELARRNAARRITPVVVGFGILLVCGLFWAFSAMPLTPASPIEALAFSPDGRTIVTAHEGKTLRLWQVQTADDERPHLTEIRKARIPARVDDYLEMATNGRHVVITRATGIISIWDAESLREVEEGQFPGCRFACPVLAQNGKALAVVSSPGRIFLWRATGKGPLLKDRPRIIGDPSCHFSRMTFTPDGDYLVSSDHAGGLHAWDSSTGESVEERLDQLGNPVVLDGTLLGTSTYPDWSPTPAGNGDGFPLWWSVQNYGVSPDRRLLASVLGGNQVLFSSLLSGEMLFLPRRSDNEARILVLGFSPDGRLVVTGDAQGRLRIGQVPAFGAD